MKYVPMLEEERFQSMVAVPILSRAGETIGVIVLHTEAPREFTEDTLKLLVHIASLVSGAIENAQLYDQQRRRVDALTSLSGLAQEVATAGDAAEIGRAVTRGMRQAARGRGLPAVPLGPRREQRSSSLSSSPETTAEPRRCRPTALLLAALRRERVAAAGADAVAGARRRRPARDAARLRAASGSGCCARAAPPRRPFSGEDTEMARAIAHLAAIAIKRAELIEGLTNANIVKDLFEALAAGATTFAAAKAAEVRCDLTTPVPDAVRRAGRPATSRPRASGAPTAEVLGRDLARARAPRGDRGGAGPGPRGAGARRAVPASGSRTWSRACRELGRRRGAAIGLSELHDVRRPTRHVPTARRSTRRRSGARCSATAARSATPRSAPTGTWSTSAPRTPRATGCGPRSTA